MGENPCMAASVSSPAARIVVIMPNWLGDGVMATPFLRALRAIYPQAHIAAVARPLVGPVLAGLPYINEIHIAAKGEDAATVRWLKQGKFDLGILLPNSFRSAWLLWRGGVQRRLGYTREHRSMLLTDRVLPISRHPHQRELDQKKKHAMQDIGRRAGRPVRFISVGSAFQPVPTIDYYLKLAEYLSAPGSAGGPPDAAFQSADARRMQLAVTEAERDEATGILSQLGLEPEATKDPRSKMENPLVVLVPGANFGSSKCWPPERFAQVADRLMDRQGPYNATVLLASSPAEMPIIDAILKASMLCPGGGPQGGIGRLHALAKFNEGQGVSLGALKEIVRRSGLMICNDTGPRHFAAAFGIPAVTLFGPTDPVWAETYSQRERLVRVNVPCGPCQLKKCPIDHRCMDLIDVDAVLQAVQELWS
jgi:heptosyltransferase-2